MDTDVKDVIKAITGGLVTLSIAEGFFGGIGNIIRSYNVTKPQKTVKENSPNTVLVAVGSFAAGAATVLVAEQILDRD